MNYPRLFVNNVFSRTIKPIQISITENIVPLSTASITMPKDETLPSRSYVELFTPYGSAGMYRVRSPHNSYGSETNTADLEHMISEVGDYLVKEKLEEMTAATTAMKTVFSYYKGGHWQLGTCAALGTGKIAMKAEYDRVLDVMLSILEQKPDCMMTFDFSTSPWTVNIVKRGTEVTAEGRLSRNVETATVTYDDSELVTRVWYQTFSKDKDGKLVETWVYKDADTKNKYGLVEGTVSTNSDMTDDEIASVVNTYIEEHKNPRVSVSIQANELSQITRETLDRLTIGKLYRLALPDYNITVEKNITSITWNDPYNDPSDVTVTLGDEEDTVVTFLHNLDSKGSGGGGGGRKKKDDENKWKEYYTDFEKTDEYIRMTAAHVDKQGSILEQAGMKLNSQGVLFYANDYPNNIGSKLTVMNDHIELRVRKDGVITSINVSPEGVVIQAKRVDLGEYAKVSQLDANFIKSKIAQIGAVTMQNVTVTGGLTCSGRITGNVVGGMTMELAGASFSNVLVSATVSGNTLTLKNQKGQSTTFSKAVTVERGWSGGKYSVTPTAGTISPADVSTTLNNNGTAYRDGSILCIPVYSDLGYTGKELYVGLSTLSSATGGLSKYGTASLYIKLGDDYSPVGNHTWYYKNSNTNLTTYYYFNG